MLRVNGLYGYMQSTAVRSTALFAGFFASLVLLWSAVYLFYLLFDYFTTSGAARRVATSQLLRVATDYPAMIMETIHIPALFAILWLAAGLNWHTLIIRTETGALPISRRDAPHLYNLVENLAITAGLPMPDVEIIETPALNAFAYGLTPETSSVAVTRGLLTTLSRDELEAVLAHELSHVRNGDARVNVVAAILQGLMSFVAAIVWTRLTRHATPLDDIFLTRPDETTNTAAVRAQKRRMTGFLLLHIAPIMVLLADSLFGRSAREVVIVIVLVGIVGWLARMLVDYHYDTAEKGALDISVLPSLKLLYFFPVWLLMMIIGFLAAMAYAIAAGVTAKISQAREFLADAGAIELTKNPGALSSALWKVSGRDHIPSSSIATMALMISSSRVGWFATHPPVEERIAAIERHVGMAMPPLPTHQARSRGHPAALAATGHTPAPSFGRRKSRLPATPRNNIGGL